MFVAVFAAVHSLIDDGVCEIRIFNVRHCDCYLIITLSMIPGLGYYLTNIPIVSHGKVGKCKLDATG